MKKLFEEFSGVTSHQWREQISRDLKGIDYSQLIYKNHNGLDTYPFYTAEDCAKNPVAVKNHSNWEICEQLIVTDESVANRLALNALEGGAGGLEFHINSKINFSELMKGISLQHIYSQFVFGFSEIYLLDELKKMCGNQNNSKMNCVVNIDPVHLFATQGNWYDSQQKDISVIEKLEFIPVDVSLYEEAGAGTVNELAMGIAHLNEYLNYLNEKKKLKGKKLHFTFSAAPDFFTEIAKLRAFRKLVALLQKQYSINFPVHIHSRTATIDKSKCDKYNNMLRTTTEAMSAIIGGADSVSVLPYDHVTGESGDFSMRIARNQQHILKNESYLDKVADISAGSYYIESITHQLAEKSWEQFKIIESKGGLLSCMKKNFIQHLISKDLMQMKKEFNEGKLVLIGVNKYVNESEIVHSDLLPRQAVFPQQTEVTPVRPVRLAANTENTRRESLSKLNSTN